MNGFPARVAPSLNGLRRFDGSSSVKSLNGLDGELTLRSADPSFRFDRLGDETITLQTPFTTVDGRLQTSLEVSATRVTATELNAPLKIRAGSNITVTATPTNEYTISSLATVDWNDIRSRPLTFAPAAHTHQISDIQGLAAALEGRLPPAATGSWSFVESSRGLNLVKDGKVKFRFVADPINLMARRSLWGFSQNGGYKIRVGKAPP